MKYIILSVCLFLGIGTSVKAQEIILPQSFTVESYDDMRQKLLLTEIPPLDTLFMGARLNNALILMSEMEVEVALREMKTEQHNWWSYFRLFGNYQYGIMASLIDITQGGVPINPQYSQQAQSWWNVGVGINIPLSEFVDRSNRIKKEKARVRLAQYNVDSKFVDIKKQIAQAYSEAILSLTLSRALYDRYVFCRYTYQVTEADFQAGRATAIELSDIKAKEIDAYIQLQKQLSSLIQYASILETLSSIPIINY